MPDVTVDSTDLEAILFAAGAANDLAPTHKLAIRKNVQFAQVEARLSDAIKRAGDKWREIGRKAQYPDRFDPPSAAELGYLRYLEREGAARHHGISEDEALDTPRGLVTNGFVDLAVFEATYAWTNRGVEREKPIQRRVRLTERGLQAVMDAREKEIAEASARIQAQERAEKKAHDKLPWWKKLWSTAA